MLSDKNQNDRFFDTLTHTHSVDKLYDEQFVLSILIVTSLLKNKFRSRENII